MDKEQQKQWCDHKADEMIEQANVNILSILPSELQLAIHVLVREAFLRGYGWGFNDGVSYIGTGREPSYHIADSTVKNIAKPHNAA
ncbi:MAG TPA: hypothetical protein VGE13_02485 [Candidatus Saccharimonadales bacterium]